jgi:hypothetical protein
MGNRIARSALSRPRDRKDYRLDVRPWMRPQGERSISATPCINQLVKGYLSTFDHMVNHGLRMIVLDGYLP